MNVTQLCFAKEVKVQNISSWSNLANAKTPTQSGVQTAAPSSSSASSFELFKKQAREKEERVCHVMCTPHHQLIGTVS